MTNFKNCGDVYEDGLKLGEQVIHASFEVLIIGNEQINLQIYYIDESCIVVLVNFEGEPVYDSTYFESMYVTTQEGVDERGSVIIEYFKNFCNTDCLSIPLLPLTSIDIMNCEFSDEVEFINMTTYNICDKCSNVIAYLFSLVSFLDLRDKVYPP